MSILNNLIHKYTKVIGGGGFGIVKTGLYPPDNKIAVKFLYAKDCPSAKREYIINKTVYNNWKIFLKCKVVDYVSVVKPYDFVEKSNCCTDLSGNEEYSCAVIMERLFSPIDDTAVHLAFSGTLAPNMQNRIIMTQKGVARGFYADPTYVENILLANTFNLKSLEDIIYRIGILEGICIFGARMIPEDVEYVLDIKDNEAYVTMIDFGMFSDINVTSDNYQQVAEIISQKQEYNLYYHPYSEAIPFDRQESCKEAFKDGMTDAYNCFENEELYNLYITLMELYDSPPS